ncbi:heavy-metal-associated domain-containing protein, partial [Enterobacter hormaechei]
MSTTNTFEVAGLLSPLAARGVEKHLAQMPGIEHVSVNAVAGSATVTYDQGRIDPERIRAAIQDCGYHCAGEMLPRHMCGPMEHAVAPAHAHGHIQHEHPERHVHA